MERSLKPDSSSVPQPELFEEFEEGLTLLECFLYHASNSASVIRQARATVIARKKARTPLFDHSSAVAGSSVR